MRVGQKNGLVYQWAKKGTRPRQPKDQRYANAYVFGAICPARDTGTALVLPRANADAMQHHLEAISCRVAPGAHAVLIGMLGMVLWPSIKDMLFQLVIITIFPINWPITIWEGSKGRLADAP